MWPSQFLAEQNLHSTKVRLKHCNGCFGWCLAFNLHSTKVRLKQLLYWILRSCFFNLHSTKVRLKPRGARPTNTNTRFTFH